MVLCWTCLSFTNARIHVHKPYHLQTGWKTFGTDKESITRWTNWVREAFINMPERGAVSHNISLSIHLVQVCLEHSILIFWGLRTLTSHFVGQSDGLILKYIVLFYLKACPRRSHAYVACCCYVLSVCLQPGAASFYLFYMFCFIKFDRIHIQVSF